MRIVAGAVAVLCTLGACAVPPVGAQKYETEAFLIRPVPQAVEGRPLIWFIGLAMQDETWSENDVFETIELMGKVAPLFQVKPIFFDNHQADPSHQVDSRSVEQAIQAVARQAAPEDVVLFYASTHGAPGYLGRQANGQDLAPVGVDEVKRWLEPLRGRDTIVILSACFAGSFIPALQDSHRIVFTAARADRASFGCQAGAEHTVFGDALLQALAQPGTSLRDAVAATRATVTDRERALHVTEPSQPQVSIGADVTRLYNAPIF